MAAMFSPWLHCGKGSRSPYGERASWSCEAMSSLCEARGEEHRTAREGRDDMAVAWA
eukprot:CAMPEP_0177684244 /NCGR_PEP_ID=MMETSP0447-20121125/32314_1 /TAXON_ID=0 /ORGANISM="Stygamoeba regulata, Strain BSH-02190019" /LENGTH=56 /DNA_ID=CAMNT_0019194051 /DNA_START=55 /DNA_END=225 /DNA_ORIENTATION=-